MITWGINALNHDASLAVITDDLLFWKKASDYSKIDRDDKLNNDLLTNALTYGKPDKIIWYEQPWVKKARQLYAGQYETAADLSLLPSRHLASFEATQTIPIKYVPHHKSHAAAGYLTSPFDHCAIVVIDAIGEFECATIWEARNGKMRKVWSRNYPNSLGLFYSAFTKLCGLEPIKQEFLLQQMSDNGNSSRYYYTVSKYVDDIAILKKNLHRGVQDWPHPIDNIKDQCDIAAAVQLVFEQQITWIMQTAQKLTKSDSLVYMGGCAMNSKANKKIANDWRQIWSLPNPGDPSSSIGAALLGSNKRIKWTGDIAKHIEIKI